MKVKLYDNKGKELEKGYEVADSIFGAKVNKSLIGQYVYSYLSNQRQANAQTRDRGEVAGGGKKPWKQKGTGRARVGSIRSPLWRGGGVTFGPSNDRNYKKPMSKKMIKEAIRSAFSLVAKDGAFAVMEKVEVKDRNTKAMVKIFDAMMKGRKITLVQNGSNVDLMMSIRNLKNIELVNVGELNPFTILKNKTLVVFDDAMQYVNDKWTGKKIHVKKVKKAVKAEKTTTKKTVKKVVKKATK